MIYNETIQTLAQNLSNYFDETYFNAEIVTIDKDKFPAINQVNEWIDLSPTDTKETLYIRRNGDDTVLEETRLSSCSKSYKLQSPLRIVYFKDNADNHGEILFKLMQSVLLLNTKLRGVIQDKWKLLKEESSGDYHFSPRSAYFAIDIYAYWTLQSDNCEQDFCITIENPLKSCS